VVESCPPCSPTAPWPGIQAGSRGGERGSIAMLTPCKYQGFWVGAADLGCKRSPRRVSQNWRGESPRVQVGSRLSASISLRVTGSWSLWVQGGGGNSFPHSHRDGALRSALGKADNSCEDKDTRDDCCLMNSGEEEYQTLVLIHPLAKHIVFLSPR